MVYHGRSYGCRMPRYRCPPGPASYVQTYMSLRTNAAVLPRHEAATTGTAEKAAPRSGGRPSAGRVKSSPRPGAHARVRPPRNAAPRNYRPAQS
ncbi:Os07g0589101 [Oryza sativa Japonica Group]|nr:Os07g0589101 [Oryza sativa Japonica Group]